MFRTLLGGRVGKRERADSSPACRRLQAEQKNGLKADEPVGCSERENQARVLLFNDRVVVGTAGSRVRLWGSNPSSPALPLTSCEAKAITQFFVSPAVVTVIVDDDDVSERVFRSGRLSSLSSSSQPVLPMAVPLMTWCPVFHRRPQGAAAAGRAGRHPAAGG